MQGHELIIGKYRTYITEHTLRKIPYFARMEKLPDSVTYEYPHLDIVDSVSTVTAISICMGRKIQVGMDVIDFKEVFVAIDLCRRWNVSEETLLHAFDGFTQQMGWAKMRNPSYLYLIHELLPEAVDFPKYFITTKDSFDFLTQMVDNKIYSKQPDAYIRALHFFSTYNLSSCFPDPQSINNALLSAMEKSRRKFGHYLLVNPKSSMAPFFIYMPPVEPNIWKCDELFDARKLAIGDPVIVDIDAALERFSRFTMGVFDGEAGKNFIWDAAVFAGGSILKLISPDYDIDKDKQADVDIFVIGLNIAQQANNFKKIILWFTHYYKDIYFAVERSVTTIYIKNIPRKFQLITSNCWTPYDVISKFDLTHVQWCFYKHKFYGTPSACMALRERTTRFCNTTHVKVIRAVKALINGYDVVKSAAAIEACPELVPILSDKNSSHLEKLVMSLFKWYYPCNDPTLDPAIEIKHILCMIAQDSQASIVTRDAAVVFKNVVYNGNFEADYQLISYKNFNPDMVYINRIARKTTKLKLRYKYGVVKLMSPRMTVINNMDHDEFITIRAKPNEPEFREFCDLIDNRHVPLFNRGEATARPLMDSEGVVEFRIVKNNLIAALDNHYYIVYTPQGTPICPDSIAPGDVIHFLFHIQIRCKPHVYAELIVVRAIKIAPEHTTDDEISQLNDEAALDDHSDEPTRADAKIQYEDTL